MKYFDFRRYAMLLRLDLVGQWRKNAIVMGGLFMACFAIMLSKLTYHSAIADNYVYHANDHAVAVTVFVFIGILWTLCLAKSASMLMAHTRSKQQFIAHFTLPATTGEKFAARLTYLVLGQTAGFALCFAAADLLQGLLFCSMHDVPMFFTPFLLRYIGDFFTENSAADVTLTLLMGLYGHATYTLGAALFRRWPFVLTTFCNWLLGLLFISGCFYIAHAYLSTETRITLTMWQEVSKIGAIVVYSAVCATFYTLSYFLYRRRQLA